MPLPTVDQQIPIGVGGGGFGDEGGGGGPIPGGTGLVLLVGLLQILGFAIPVVTYTAETTAPAVAEATAEPGFALSWSYGEFSLQAPGLTEWLFYLPALGLAAMLTVVLPTRFLRPILLVVLGAIPLAVLWRSPEIQAHLLERLPLFGWGVAKSSALKGLGLLALALAGAVIGSHAPRAVAIVAAVVGSAAAVPYLGVPLPDAFPGGFAWRQSFDELMASRPPETTWSTVTGHYVLLVTFAIDLIAIGLACIMCLVSLRGTWHRAGKWIGGCVAVSLATALLVIAGRSIRPLADPMFEFQPLVCDLAYSLKMLLATSGIALLLPVGLIDLIGRGFGRQS
jgi:hypothetical protein